MTELPTWPPPPATPEPLSEHDDFLTACVRASTPKPPLSRLRLVKDLHQETGRDLRHCLAVVTSFCDRHAILMPVRGLEMWLGCLLPLVYIMAMTAMGITTFLLMQSQHAAITYAEKLAFRSEGFQLGTLYLVVALASIGANILFIHRRQKTMREQARAKLD